MNIMCIRCDEEIFFVDAAVVFAPDLAHSNQRIDNRQKIEPESTLASVIPS